MEANDALGRMFLEAAAAVLRKWQHAADHIRAYGDCNEAQMKLRSICATREQFDTAVSLCPVFDGSRGRELALNRVTRHVLAGEPPEKAREAAQHTWVEECAWMSEAAHGAAMNAERCSEAFRRFGEAYGRAKAPKRGRGRNRRFHGPQAS